MVRTIDAWSGRADRGAVQLSEPGGDGAEGSPTAGHPAAGERGAARLSPDFARLYASTGRASIAPEKLLRALLLQAFYSVRSERQLMEQLTYNMLFRWFVGLSMDAPVWDVTVFTKNRERLLEGDIARA